jgi:hypothetical protein
MTVILNLIPVILGLVIIVPIVAILGGIVYGIATFTLDINKTAKGIVTVLLVIATVILFSGFGALAGWRIYGLEWLQDALIGAWNYLATLPQNILSIGIKVGNIDLTIGRLLGINISDMPNYTLTQLSAQLQNPKTFSLTLTSIYPLIISIVTFFIALFYITASRDPKPILEDPSGRFHRWGGLNLPFLLCIPVFLICVFVFYLSFTADAFINYQNVGFISIYSLITVSILILLGIGIGTPTKNGWQTFSGVVFGVILLFIFQNLFTQQQTLSVVANEVRTPTIIQLWTTGLFVAPSESLMFHVFLTSLVVAYFLRKNRVLSVEELEQKRQNLRIEITSLGNIAEINKNLGNSKAYAKTMQLLNKRQIELVRLEKSSSAREPTTAAIAPAQFLILLLCITGFNVIFSCLHWFKSGLTFEIFWSSGLGFIYLSSGVIMSLISYRFGWASGVIAHALHNSLILALVSVM